MRGILVQEVKWAVDVLNLIVQRLPVNDTTDQRHHQSFIVISGKARESVIVSPDRARTSDQDNADDKTNVATHTRRHCARSYCADVLSFLAMFAVFIVGCGIESRQFSSRTVTCTSYTLSSPCPGSAERIQKFIPANGPESKRPRRNLASYTNQSALGSAFPRMDHQPSIPAASTISSWLTC